MKRLKRKGGAKKGKMTLVRPGEKLVLCKMPYWVPEGGIYFRNRPITADAPTKRQKTVRYHFGKVASGGFDKSLKYGEHKRIGIGGLPPVAMRVAEKLPEKIPAGLREATAKEWEETREAKRRKLYKKYAAFA